MKAWRLLDTGALPANLNMGIDQALLELHARGESPPTLRFYQWDPPAVSLGYFQRRHSIDVAACRELGLDIIKRATGGHAVLHMHDLTYSVIAGKTEGMPADLTDAYMLLGEGLVSGFRLLGFDTERGGDTLPPSKTDICFLRFAPGDVFHKGKKFVGSAQTLKGSSMLQHGSVAFESQVETWIKLLSLNPDRNDVWRSLESRTTSIGEILGRQVEYDEVKAALTRGMSSVLAVAFYTGKLTDEEMALACEYADKQSIKTYNRV